MILSEGSDSDVLYKEQFHQHFHSDLVIVGGGISGVCAAISAAREGLKVILVQDRPVLGGNASSEVRLWILGATSHMGNNNRWAREGGVIDELLIENMYRNPDGNAVIFDTILLDKVVSESNIVLLLNTVVHHVIKHTPDTIAYVEAFCSQNQISYKLEAPYFIDASGDGIVAFRAGAAFRMGAESTSEFQEKFAPSKEYGELLGHSLYFYSKNVGHPVKYVPPSYAIKDITEIPRFKNFNTNDFGCRLWWIEFGGRMDTVKDTESIKWELWKIVYGVWDHIKNSGQFPEAENLTLEWVGSIPGKRESRRFEGDYIIKQQDIIEQRSHLDAVAYGGWSIDLHPADGIYSEKPGCNQWHSKGVYQIPLRSLYSRNIKNLLIAGRLISASHVAFGSTRVMATCGAIGQAAASAVVLCKKYDVYPRDLTSKSYINELQQLLLNRGAYIPGFQINENVNLVKFAKLSASSELALSTFPDASILKTLDSSVAQMVPLEKGMMPTFSISVSASKSTVLHVELRISEKSSNHTPELILGKRMVELQVGENDLVIDFELKMPETAYAYLVFLQNSNVTMHYSSQRITGILSVFNSVNPAVSNYGAQKPKEDIGVDTFEFWCPKRRPEGHNLAFALDCPLRKFSVENLVNGIDRPTNQPNAWVASLDDPTPSIEISWNTPQKIKKIVLCFDADFDHPMESVLMGHPENIMPFCIQEYTLSDQKGKILADIKNNYQTMNTITFSEVNVVEKLYFKCKHPSKDVPASLFAIRCFEQ